MVTLDELESRLQSLLEVHLLKYMPGYKVEDGIAQQLAATLRRNLKENDGVSYAPNLFMIVAHPSTLARWHTKPRLLKELANALYIAGKESGFLFSIKPTLITTTDMNMPTDGVSIIASFSDEILSETHGISLAMPPAASGKAPGNAFLIVEGTKIVPLTRSVISIGRRLDNTIIINDPRVSRAHAQLRIVKGHYVLFDLNSSGGTFVNDHRIDQAVLNPGDVVSLSGVPLIFGQDLPASQHSNDETTEPRPTTSVQHPAVKNQK